MDMFAYKIKQSFYYLLRMRMKAVWWDSTAVKADSL